MKSCVFLLWKLSPLGICIAMLSCLPTGAMAQKGKLPAFKVGGQWRFRRTDLDAWIDAKTRRSDGNHEDR